ncbi:MAG: OsmC family protein [Proteobacteria bacterium]|nr:OsmC family protein [Pseudomonadota bacterium]
MKSTVTLVENMAFDVDQDGHHFTIDAKAEHGGEDSGPSPKALLLSSLAGCASMDVVSILRKMRQPLTKLAVHAEAELTEEHPKVFGEMTVVVEVEGDVNPKRLWRSVALSRDQYCGVAAMLRSHAPIHYKVLLNGVELPEPT